MMQLLFDLHTHTIASGHAFSTLKENIDVAYERGLKAYGFSEHGPSLVGAPKPIYFENYKIIPRQYKDMKVLAGIEANIIDMDGNIDVTEKMYGRIDYIIASFHSICVTPGSLSENMKSYSKVMQNEFVKVIGHPDDSRFELDYNELAKMASEFKVALEVNNSSLTPVTSRVNCRENIIKMLDYCMKYETKIICGTDSHICNEIGDFTLAREMLEYTHFPEELVLNTKLENLDLILNI